MLAALGLLAVGCGFQGASEALSPTSSPSAPTPSASASEAIGMPDPTSGEVPPIVVRTPLNGDLVSSPLTIAGTADVFEATVSVRILDARGRELASGFATATCGSGCRGRYRTKLFFFTPERQAGTVEVYESSAEDGSQLFLVTIPVTLVPGA